MDEKAEKSEFEWGCEMGLTASNFFYNSKGFMEL